MPGQLADRSPLGKPPQASRLIPASVTPDGPVPLVRPRAGHPSGLPTAGIIPASVSPDGPAPAARTKAGHPSGLLTAGIRRSSRSLTGLTGLTGHSPQH